jgi:hypothetical protein
MYDYANNNNNNNNKCLLKLETEPSPEVLNMCHILQLYSGIMIL